MNTQINQQACPFCQGVNNCMINNKTPCWCNDAAIPPEIIALVPSTLQNKTCICLGCINLFNENPENFKNKYSLSNL